MADIFISYTSSDRDWAFWVGHELQALGHTPRIHEWEIPAGDDIAAWMEARHDAADHILCIVSSAYLTKPYSAWERHAAQWAAVTDRPNFAVPVFVEPCKAPTLFAEFLQRVERRAGPIKQRVEMHCCRPHPAISCLGACRTPATGAFEGIELPGRRCHHRPSHS
jgi:TIR domain